MILLTLPAWLPLVLDPGLVNTRAGGDSPFLLQRVHQMTVALQGGHFPVRWMPDAAYGHGYPFWNYYAPLAFYGAAALVLTGVGIVESIKLIQILGFLGAAAGMYRLADEVLNSRAAAVLAAVAYTYAPFHLVNVYVRGDSLGEFTAFAFYPLVLLELHRLRRHPGPGSAALAALAYASLVLSHNISALMFTPFAALYALILWSSGSGSPHFGLPTADREPGTQPNPQSPIPNPQSAMGWTLVAFVLGLALSAFYWVPALLERNAVQLEQNLTGYFHYAGHFRGVNLVQRSLLFNFAVDAAGTPFAMGLVQAALGTAGLLAVLVISIRSPVRSTLRPFVRWFYPATALMATFLITPGSRFLWDHLPLLSFVQFPWRWLSVQALAAAMLVGVLARLPRRPWGRWAVVGVAGGLTIATALAGLRVAYLPVGDGDVTPQRLMLYEIFTGNIGSTVRAEYLPRAVNPRPWTSGALSGTPEPPVGADEAQLLGRGPAAQRWRVRLEADRELVFATYWFPGWQAAVDGQPVETAAQPGHGGLRVRVPAGTHEVRLWLGHTPLRLTAELLSLLAGVILAGVAVAARPRGRDVAKAVLGGAAAVAVALLILALNRARAGPVNGPLTMDFSRMPYLHANPGGLRWPGEVVLQRYTLGQKELLPGQALEVEMDWEGIRPGSQAELALVSPAEVLFGVPAILDTDRAPLQPTTSFRLTVPEHANPGPYLLRLRVFDGDGEQSEERVYLEPVRVRARPRPLAEEGIEFGDVALLGAVVAEQPSPDRLRVDLTWQAQRSIAVNYATSVRLQDATGQTVASADTQPCYGFCPTALWQPGVAVYDRRWLALPEGLSPGNDYRLEVVLYEVATLQPVGTARMDGVVLTQPTIQPDVPPGHRFDGLGIVDAKLDRAEAEPGERVPVTLRWSLRQPISRDLQARLLLLAAARQVVHEELAPIAPGFGTSRWPVGALVARTYVLTLPRDLPPGEYRVAIGVAGAEEIFDPGLPLRVTPSTRVFEPPDLPHRLNVDFGGQIRLLGYELEQDANALSLLVAWQALTDIDRSYKTFIHLFDPATGQIVAQRDTEPRGGDHPTSTWVEGEVVTDGFHIGTAGPSTASGQSLPPGTYRLAIGLYDPGTGRRLPAVTSHGQRLADDRVVLEEVVRIEEP